MKSIHMICFHYGKYGHFVEEYLEKLGEPPLAMVEANSDKGKDGGVICAPKSNFVYGNWILVQKSRKL